MPAGEQRRALKIQSKPPWLRISLQDREDPWATVAMAAINAKNKMDLTGTKNQTKKEVGRASSVRRDGMHSVN